MSQAEIWLFQLNLSGTFYLTFQALAQNINCPVTTLSIYSATHFIETCASVSYLIWKMKLVECAP